MRWIEGVRIGGGLAPARRSRSAGGFALPGPAEEPAEAAGTAAAAVAPLGLLALQEGGPDPRERDARAVRRGAALLRELSGMQRDALSGRRDPERLRRIAQLAEGELAANRILSDVLEGIVLRAKVELARASHVTASKETTR